MAWRIDNGSSIPILTDGNYALVIGAPGLARLKAAAAVNIGELEKALYAAAAFHHIKPHEARDALCAAFKADGRSADAILNEIRSLL